MIEKVITVGGVVTLMVLGLVVLRDILSKIKKGKDDVG